MNKEIIFSNYQLDFFDFVENGTGNAVVQAVAGSGKSFSITHAVKLIPESKRVLFNAFNVSTVSELKHKIDRKNVQISTSHGLGFQFIKSHFRGKIDNFEVDEYKYTNHFKQCFPELIEGMDFLNKHQVEEFKENVLGLLNLSRVYLCKTEEDINNLADIYDFTFIHEEPKIILYLINWGMENIETIDYTDMIALPNYLDMTPSNMRFDFVIVDEAQDLNKAQQELIKRTKKKGGTRYIYVGDGAQCINSFAGSNLETFNELAKQPDTITLPLSICYRCPKVIEAIAKKYVKNFEVAKTAIEGSIIHDVKTSEIKDGGMVLCRTTAPLVSLYMRLIRENKKAFVRGKDIGINMKKMVEKTEQPLLNKDLKQEGVFVSLYKHLFETRDKLMQNRGLDYNDAVMHTKTMYVYDMIQALAVLSEGIYTTKELVNKIETVFTDNDSGVILSTVHKAKGLENDDIYILCPSLLPSPMANKDWELQSEKNLEYVAYTRTKNRLNFICEKDFPPAGSFINVDGMISSIKSIEQTIHNNQIELEKNQNTTPPNKELISMPEKKKRKKVVDKDNTQTLEQIETLESVYNKKIKTFSNILLGETMESANEKFNDLGIVNTIRVVVHDGKACIVTHDYKPDRVNISISNGVIDDIIGFG